MPLKEVEERKRRNMKFKFQVVYYSKDSLTKLCESYSDIANKCLLEKCHVEDNIASFVSRHFSFACKQDFEMEKFASQECITETVVRSNCSVLINQEPQIGGEMFCPKLEEFLSCVEQPLKVSCRTDAFQYLVGLVANYGCLIVTGSNQLLSTEVTPLTGALTEDPAISVKLGSPVKNDEDDLHSFATTTVENELTPTFELHKSDNFLNDRTTVIHEQQDNGITTFSELVEDIPNKQENDALESSGEIPITESIKILKLQENVHSAIVTAEPNIITNNYNSENMTDCYTSIVGDFGRYLHSSPTASFVRFPLFGIKPMELEVLCAKFEVATKCVEKLCTGNCRLPPIKSFVDSQLKEACMLRETPDFMMEFTCLQNILKENTLLTDDSKLTPKSCGEKLKTSALSCLAPLLRLWTGIKDNRKDTEVVFPIFEFSRIELLELCDSFANYRNCVRNKNTSSCKSEPIISFAEEHFGQICTTQQIEASMKTHDCINSINISEMAFCQKFSRGETSPGKRKCSKVRRYTKCVRKLVSKLCGHLLLAQFDMIVNRFGCE
ncbi:hypothetical protein CAEBREN_14247 [Caenorhabditis brenneri]|uniref:DUF19 domain-containing protein n=1 Tax=Caenorhabditis brenneri TaxID=135651 RepID=G0MSF6_CAEBE|nr:hypothetical protein CAEBREN_14247 [Caenorhabditis brenneri]